MPDYILRFEDGNGSYWKAFDGETGNCIKYIYTKRAAKKWRYMNNKKAAQEAIKAAGEFFKPVSDGMMDEFVSKPMYSLGDCKPCTAPDPFPPCNITYGEAWYRKEEGNNPMIMSKTCSPSTAAASSVSINVPETPSDEMKQRDYLLTQLKDMTRYEWNDDFWIGRCFSKLREKYNIGASSIPKTTQEVIDAFKNKRVEIDQKMVDKQTAYFKARDEHSDDYEYESGIESRYYGLKFLDLPVADHKGYEKATQDLRDLVKKTEREIYIFSPEHGLKALMDLEAHTIH